MNRLIIIIRMITIAVMAVLIVPTAAMADTNDATQAAMKAASSKVAPCIVKIETSGGVEIIPGASSKGAVLPNGPGIRKGVGPTTGLIVDSNGFVITSSFNFANKPTAITVIVPGRAKKWAAKVIATDQTRMLTLLQLQIQEGDLKDFPVPLAFPKQDIEVGLWALALGRTSDPEADHPPSMSIGIVSAMNRIWGKAIQTDAKTSPVNYGGPLVSIDGRVFGVIVPMSNRGEGETAGVDVYDGGIGFAVPLEDVLHALPRLKQGQDLRRGLLGITLQGTDVYNAPPVVGSVQSDSAASRAGIQIGDRILEIDGRAIRNYSTLQHILGPLYEGDEIALRIKRGDREQNLKNVKLRGTVTAHVNAFLGLLPMRDDPGPGVEVRYVYPNSPADAAGVKAGDRVVRLGVAGQPVLTRIQNRADLLAAMQRMSPGMEVKLEIKRKAAAKSVSKNDQDKKVDKRKSGEDEMAIVTAKLIPDPNILPEKLPLPSSAGRALRGQPKPKKGPKDPFAPNGTDPDRAEKVDKAKVETGFFNRTNQSLGREYWIYIPDNYDSGKSYGLVIWFHGQGQGGKDGERMSKIFRNVCEDYNFIVTGPKSVKGDGWVPSETELVMQDVKTILSDYTIDKTRIVTHGMSNGGQMAFYVGLHARDMVRGVATIGAVLGTNPKENIANQPLSFFISGGDKDPLIKEIITSKDLLLEKRFPVVFQEIKESGKEYFDAPTFAKLLSWLDALDRI